MAAASDSSGSSSHGRAGLIIGLAGPARRRGGGRAVHPQAPSRTELPPVVAELHGASATLARTGPVRPPPPRAAPRRPHQVRQLVGRVQPAGVRQQPHPGAAEAAPAAARRRPRAAEGDPVRGQPEEGDLRAADHRSATAATRSTPGPELVAWTARRPAPSPGRPGW